jgi:hypothetical protein
MFGHPEFGVRVWEYDNRQAVVQSSTSVATLVSIDDSSLALSPTLGAATLPSDAYLNASTLGGYAGKYFVYGVKLIAPGTPTDTLKEVRINIGAVASATYQHSYPVYIPYNPSATYVETWEFLAHNQTLLTPAHFKVDWEETDATLADRPTVEFVSLRNLDTALNLSLTSTTNFF